LFDFKLYAVETFGAKIIWQALAKFKTLPKLYWKITLKAKKSNPVLDCF